MSEFQLDPVSRNQRRAAIGQHPTQIGLDYVEVVSHDPLQVVLYFIPALSATSSAIPQNLTAEHIQIAHSDSGTQSDLQIQSIHSGKYLFDFDWGSNQTALEFDGANGYVEIPASDHLNKFTSLTWEVWFKPSAQTGEKKVLWHEEPDGIQIIWRGESSQKGAIEVGVHFGTAWVFARKTGFDFDAWYHVAGVVTSNTLQLFVNGELQHTVSVTAQPLVNSSKPWRLARWNSSGFDFKGQIAELRIWSVARTIEQIRATLYDHLSGNEPGLVGYWRLDEGTGQIASDTSSRRHQGLIVSARWVELPRPIGHEHITQALNTKNIPANLRVEIEKRHSPLQMPVNISQQDEGWIIRDESAPNKVFSVQPTGQNQFRIDSDFQSAITATLTRLTTQQNALESTHSPGYRLSLVNLPEVDRFFSTASLSLETSSAREFDSLSFSPETPIPPQDLEIDYLARDYSSFRQLMLDRLSVLMPHWKERHPADLGTALVEVLAYAGDRLSYYQDAVATEAYLGTARRRISVKRHAQLLDYRMHEGCNARTWVHIQVSADSKDPLPAGTRLTTRAGERTEASLSSADFQALKPQLQVFATLHPLELKHAHNQLPFYDWGVEEFYLPVGTTSATLNGSFPDLQRGDVLILEEMYSPTTGQLKDASIKHRHPVRITQVLSQGLTDPLHNSVPLTQIEWAIADALPFLLYISKRIGEQVIKSISVARGNIVLAEHGQQVMEEELPRVGDRQRYHPRLQQPDLTHAVPYHHAQAQTQPANLALVQDPRQAIPMINLQGAGETWWAQRDLLRSDRFARDFVVETESDGFAYLRFGDGTRGRQPQPNVPLTATYRVGRGTRGNVGQGAIAHLITPDPAERSITLVRNPLPAQGGTDPETIEQVRLYAPQVFRAEQQRCITAEDYRRIAERHPEVQLAAAILRWTGSWYTAFIAVKRQDSRPVDSAFQHTLGQFLEPYRLAGYGLAIVPPRYVPLDIALTVKLAAGFFASTVKKSLTEAFSNADLPNGQRGFFHPDRLTFGQSVYLSQVIQAAMQVAGVAGVYLPGQNGSPQIKFQRWGAAAQDELETGRIAIGPLEMAYLDNASRETNSGRITFHLEGGL
jgi:hypothetical protein